MPLEPTSDGRKIVDTTTGEVLALADAQARLEELTHRPVASKTDNVVTTATPATRQRCTPTFAGPRRLHRERIWPHLEKVA